MQDHESKDVPACGAEGASSAEVASSEEHQGEHDDCDEQCGDGEDRGDDGLRGRRELGVDKLPEVRKIFAASNFKVGSVVCSEERGCDCGQRFDECWIACDDDDGCERYRRSRVRIDGLEDGRFEEAQKVWGAECAGDREICGRLWVVDGAVGCCQLKPVQRCVGGEDGASRDRSVVGWLPENIPAACHGGSKSDWVPAAERRVGNVYGRTESASPLNPAHPGKTRNRGRIHPCCGVRPDDDRACTSCVEPIDDLLL
ncbi:hypothetical protein EDF53_3253 [Curtobacterium sp. PhB78]|nr:hypothetical protein EDF53_3253 [Curtobacterium sp. PhB78]